MDKLSKTCDRGHEYWGDLCDTCYPRTAHTPTPEVGKTMDKKFAIVYKDLSFSTENENMIEQYKAKSNFLTVLPYDFYWNFDKDEMTTRHNERMYDKVIGWIDGYKAMSLQCEAKDAEIKELRGCINAYLEVNKNKRK